MSQELSTTHHDALSWYKRKTLEELRLQNFRQLFWGRSEAAGGEEPS